MKVEQLNPQQIDWTKPQVVVHSESGSKVVVVTNHKPFNEEYFSGVEMSTGLLHGNLYKNLYTSENATQYPIELKLTIETPEELCDLWNRANISHNDVMDNIYSYLVHDAFYEPSFWKELDKLAKERNLYKND